MPINRSPLQQSVHDIGTHLRRIANTPDWSDDALCPTDAGDHGVVVTRRIGAEITADHPLYGDSPPRHDPSHDSRALARDVLRYGIVDSSARAVIESARKYYPTVRDLLTAHRASWIGTAVAKPLNDAGTTIGRDAFLELLRESPTAKMRYVANATDDVPKWECLDYADCFKAWAIAVGIYPIGYVLDYKGGHSYNTALVYHEDDGQYEVIVIEPQGNVVVPKAYPARHYTGTGEVLYY